ncbi:hypothetical protein Efla_007680 [Eimeria flavescens]
MHPLGPPIATIFVNNSSEVIHFATKPRVDWDHGSSMLSDSDHCYMWQAVYSDAQFHDESVACYPFVHSKTDSAVSSSKRGLLQLCINSSKLPEKAQPLAAAPAVLAILQDFPDIQKESKSPQPCLHRGSINTLFPFTPAPNLKYALDADCIDFLGFQISPAVVQPLGDNVSPIPSMASAFSNSPSTQYHAVAKLSSAQWRPSASPSKNASHNSHVASGGKSATKRSSPPPSALLRTDTLLGCSASQTLRYHFKHYMHIPSATTRPYGKMQLTACSRARVSMNLSSALKP